MKNKKILFTILTWCLYTHISCETAQALISFFIRPYPHFPEYCQEVSKKLQKPGNIAKTCLYGLLDYNLVAGVASVYWGWLTISDDNGQISFPREHPTTSLKLLVTNRITPNIIGGNTLHHWELEQGTPAVMYTAEQKQDEETKLFYWDIQETTLPENRRISTDTIFILAKPHNVYIPTGLTVSKESPHLLLPDIYVKKGIKLVSNILYILNVKHFFGQLHTLYEKKPSRYSTRLIY